jgi:predicted flap endonuclease-1-like 5' DNA nuclease
MWDIITKIWLCLLIAAILGGIIGWLLKTLFGSKCKKCEEYEGNLQARDKEIANLKASAGSASASASAENAKDDAEIASLKKQISTLKSDLDVCHGRQETIEGELRAATLSSAGAGAVGGDSSGLQAEIDALKLKLSETENERVYLLGQVKKAEAGESIRREVPMDQRDDLELINGVGPVLERMLYDMGVYFFKDIAGWDSAKIAEMDEKLPNFSGRIEREGWVESAKEEHFKKYGDRL